MRQPALFEGMPDAVPVAATPAPVAERTEAEPWRVGDKVYIHPWGSGSGVDYVTTIVTAGRRPKTVGGATWQRKRDGEWERYGGGDRRGTMRAWQPGDEERSAIVALAHERSIAHGLLAGAERDEKAARARTVAHTAERDRLDGEIRALEATIAALTAGPQS